MSSYGNSPSVSVVIPTRNRPSLVAEAVRSVLAQVVPPQEIIVVIDGGECSSNGLGATHEALSIFEDARLRVLTLPVPAGGSEARNAGVRAAVGEWIAFLDDDDQWLPEKLSVQLAALAWLPLDRDWVLSCPVLARSPLWEEVWPRVPYHPSQPLVEYLFCRKGWFAGRRYGGALLQTSTLLAPRRLLLRCPFAPGLAKHQDWDWLLRVSRQSGVAIHQITGAPLVVFHVEGDRPSVGRSLDWQFSLTWALNRRELFTTKALAAFVATECAAQAQTAGMREHWLLLRVLISTGLPAIAELLHMVIFLLMPQPTRRAFRERLRPKRLSVEHGPLSYRAP